jgi:hypothetical protein
MRGFSRACRSRAASFVVVIEPAREAAASKEDDVRYMLLIYSDPSAWANATQEEQQKVFGEYGAFTQEIIASGEFSTGDPLQGVETATTVRVKDGDALTTDGPFAETKEVLAGYYVVDVPDLDRAIELAAKIPDAAWGWGSIEVRPVMEVDPGAGGMPS